MSDLYKRDLWMKDAWSRRQHDEWFGKSDIQALVKEVEQIVAQAIQGQNDKRIRQGIETLKQKAKTEHNGGRRDIYWKAINPTNPDIAHVLYLRRLMERVGRGTQKIIAACEELGAKPPRWQDNPSGVVLTIYSAGSVEGPRLTARQSQVMERLRPGDMLTLRDYVREQDVSERQARRDLVDLEEAGLVRRLGRGRATTYQRTERTI